MFVDPLEIRRSLRGQIIRANGKQMLIVDVANKLIELQDPTNGLHYQDRIEPYVEQLRALLGQPLCTTTKPS